MLMPCELCGSYGTGSHKYKLQNQPCIKLYGDSCGPCREIVSLEAEIVEAQAALVHKFERHRELRGKLNQSHSLINRRMPTEIMSSIFQFCLPPELERKLDFGIFGKSDLKESDFEDSIPLILGAVCQTWRSIAWSTPRIWNQIYIGLDFKKISRQNELAQQWLSRSGDLPLKICADIFDDTEDNEDEEDEEDEDAVDTHNPWQIIDTINQYACRWGDLYLNLPAQYISQLEADSGAPHLRTVFLKPTIDYLPGNIRDVWLAPEAKPWNVCLDLSLCDNGRHLRLNAFHFYWKSVTRLQLLHLATPHCMAILKRASELTYFEMESVDNTTAIIPSSELIVHPKIRCFKYKTRCTAVPAPLQFPALVEFHCVVRSGGQLEAPLFNWLKSVLEGLSSLERLFLNVESTDKRLIDILKMAHSVQYLHLTTTTQRPGTPTPINENFGKLLEHIASTSLPIESDPTNSLSFLPNLQSLTCVFGCTIPWIDIPTVFGPLSDIDNPLRRPLNSFKIFDTVGPKTGNTAGKTYDIFMNVIPKLVELQRAGIDIEVRHQRTNTDMLKAVIEQNICNTRELEQILTP